MATGQWSNANDMPVFAVFHNNDNSNGNAIVEVFWINSMLPVVHIFLFYI